MTSNGELKRLADKAADRLLQFTPEEAAEAFRDNLDAAGPITCDECHAISDGTRWRTIWGWSVAKFVGLAETIVDCRGDDGPPVDRGALFASIIAEVGEMILCPECGGAKHVPEIVPECISVRVDAGTFFEAEIAARVPVEIEIPIVAEVSAPEPPEGE
jgi:hypothetical protein